MSAPTTDRPTAAPPVPDDGLDPRRWWTLAVLCLSLLIVFVGNSSLNVALPTLSRELNATNSQLQWVVAIYSLVFAGLLFTTGALGDRFGRKGMLQLGLVLFMVGAGLASMSTAMWQIIGCRAIMGAAAALIMPSTLSIIINVFPAQERPKAIAIWASVTGAAGALGPLASGVLLGHFWFGSVFLVNVPIIILALVAGHFLVPKSKDPGETDLDPVGAVLSIIGIVALVYGLIQAPENGWASGSTLTAFAIAVAVLGAFVAWELRNPHPMLDIRFFKNPAFSTGTGGMILVFLSMYGVMFLITQYFQLVLGFSPLSAAVRFLPLAPIMICISPLTPRLSRRFGANKTVAAGLLGVALSMAMFHALEVDTSYWYILLCVFPLATGISLAMSPMTASIMSAVPPERAGAGSAMNDATRELGAALGVAILGSVAASKYAAGISSSVARLSPEAAATAQSSLADAMRTAATLPKAAGADLTAAAQQAFVNGIHLAVVVGAILAVGSALLVLKFLPRNLTPDVEETPVESMEVTAELGLGGFPPLLAEERPR